MSKPWGTSPWASLGAVAVQPLADQGGPVAGLLQPGGEGVAPVLHPVPPVGVEVAGDAVVVGVLAGDEGRPGRAAEREGVDRVGEAGAPGGEQLAHVRHVGDVGEGLVVGHHHEDVRPLAGARLARLGGGRRRQGEHGDRATCDQDAVYRLAHSSLLASPTPGLGRSVPVSLWGDHNAPCHTVSTRSMLAAVATETAREAEQALQAGGQGQDRRRGDRPDPHAAPTPS